MSSETRLQQKLLEQIRKCGLTFNIWQCKDKDAVDWTSLRGNDRRTLFEKFPPMITDLLSGEEGEIIQKLWEDFYLIYKLINSDGNPDIVHQKAKKWVDTFLQVKSDGHQRKNITPYIHIMVYHIPQLMRLHGGIKRFTGQGLEKNNDSARRNYFSSNHQDAPKEILVTDGRLHQLSKYAREKRPY
jgi:hypothetical protein